MSRALKSLLVKEDFEIFGMLREIPKINYLAFTNDMIIICKHEVGPLLKVTSTLERYERIFGQKINKEKSAIYLHKGVLQGVVVIVDIATRILRKDFSLTYLRCPIFHIRKKKEFYQYLIHKISSKLQELKGKMLSYGGRAILVKQVLQSIPIHSLLVMNPPANVMNIIQRMLAQFF